MGDFLPKMFKRKNINLDIIDFQILNAWHKAVGPQISAQTAPFKFKNKTIFINVSTPAWLQQLRFMKQEIMDKVNSEFKGGGITNIHFSIGDIPKAFVKPEDRFIDPDLRLLKERDKRIIRENLAQIRDKELKDILKRVMTKEIIKRRMNE